jgi:hypothetical protein
MYFARLKVFGTRVSRNGINPLLPNSGVMGAERYGFNFLQNQIFLSTQPRQLQLCASTTVLWDKVDVCVCVCVWM